MASVTSEARNLALLDKSTNSSRVFNCNLLTRMLIDKKTSEGFSSFFETKSLNNIIVLKHRLRDGEGEAFRNDHKISATKIIMPFNPRDLRDGGKFAFLGEDGISYILHRDFGIDLKQEKLSFKRDLAVLEHLDQLPSLDPFLLKETMSRLCLKVDDGYFDLTPSEWEDIRKFVISEFIPLAEAAFTESSNFDVRASQIVDKMWEGRDTQFLTPILRLLGLDPDSAGDILFSLKGLLYYKYSAKGLREALSMTTRQIMKMNVTGLISKEERIEIDELRQHVAAGMMSELRAAHSEIDNYDQVFLQQFIKEKKGSALKTMLEEAPQKFCRLGASIGSISHAVSFWKFKFKTGMIRSCQHEEFRSIMEDFAQGLEQSGGYAGSNQSQDAVRQVG